MEVRRREGEEAKEEIGAFEELNPEFECAFNSWEWTRSSPFVDPSSLQREPSRPLLGDGDTSAVEFENDAAQAKSRRELLYKLWNKHVEKMSDHHRKAYTAPEPFDLPEKMIGQDPVYYLKKKFGQWGRDSGAFTAEALKEYFRCFTPETIHASCEDYRASASIDLEHDRQDEDRRIEAPLLAIWGARSVVGELYDVKATWEEKALKVKGVPLPCGHAIPEEAPAELTKHILEFLGC